jgi:hypothetical protein
VYWLDALRQWRKNPPVLLDLTDVELETLARPLPRNGASGR